MAEDWTPVSRVTRHDALALSFIPSKPRIETEVALGLSLDTAPSSSAML